MNENVLIALIGVGGAIVGSVATVSVEWLRAHLANKAEERRDKPRKDLLKKLLQSKKFQWRRLDTLMHVIGADEETTKRLLLDIGARASEDGQPLWGLVSRNPLPESDTAAD
ncbi:MAG TPA: hypothetical protein VM889_06290 [Candidatus Thermoplasmatota archaeon]|jgi:hypothetical protein|nr:hypothetical protein [Candidatus Thermoplasmatota archaeon]